MVGSDQAAVSAGMKSHLVAIYKVPVVAFRHNRPHVLQFVCLCYKLHFGDREHHSNNYLGHGHRATMPTAISFVFCDNILLRDL